MVADDLEEVLLLRLLLTRQVRVVGLQDGNRELQEFVCDAGQLTGPLKLLNIRYSAGRRRAALPSSRG